MAFEPPLKFPPKYPMTDMTQPEMMEKRKGGARPLLPTVVPPPTPTRCAATTTTELGCVLVGLTFALRYAELLAYYRRVVASDLLMTSSCSRALLSSLGISSPEERYVKPGVYSVTSSRVVWS